MNAERLHVIARAIRSEMQELNLIQNLQQLVGSLQNQINQPQQPSHQQAVSQKLRELYEQLEKAPSNRFSPAWRQVFEEIGAQRLLGSHLAGRLRAVFERNQITPAIALDEIRAIHQETSSLESAINQVTTAFTALRISAQDLEPGQCEIGVLIPRMAVDNRLDEFADELREIDFIFATFSEVVTTKRDSFEIRSVSSSDLTVYLNVLPPITACIAFAVERVIRTYKTLMEIRKLHADLRKQGVPEDQLKGVEGHANGLMEDGIEKVVGEIVEKYCNVSGNRRNELKNGLRISLNKLANRIDRGYNIEIRVEPMNPPAEGEEPSEEEKAARQHIATIQEKAGALEFMRLEDKPILSLPESEEAKRGGKTRKKT